MSANSPEPASYGPPGEGGGLLDRVRWSYNAPQKRRLWGQICSIDARLASLRAGNSSGPEGDDAGRAAIRDADHTLTLAREMLRDRFLDESWRMVRAAETALLPTLSDEELQVYARQVMGRADQTVGPWMSEQLNSLLHEPGAAVVERAATRQSILALLNVFRTERDKHLDNRYRSSRYVARSLRLAAVVMVALLTLLFLAVRDGWSSALVDAGPHAQAVGGSVLASDRNLAMVALFGMLGAALSITLSTVRDRRLGRAAQVEQDYSVSWIRPILGATSAVALNVLVNTAPDSVVTIGASGVPALAIAAGFTERILRRSLAALEAGNGSTGQNEKESSGYG